LADSRGQWMWNKIKNDSDDGSECNYFESQREIQRSRASNKSRKRTFNQSQGDKDKNNNHNIQEPPAKKQRLNVVLDKNADKDTINLLSYLQKNEIRSQQDLEQHIASLSEPIMHRKDENEVKEQNNNKENELNGNEIKEDDLNGKNDPNQSAVNNKNKNKSFISLVPLGEQQNDEKDNQNKEEE